MNGFIFRYFSAKEIKSETFTSHPWYFLTPIISAVLVLFSYLVLRRVYHPEKEHYLLHVIMGSLLYIPQMIPPFFYGLNAIYTAWTFVLATTATGTVIFQDLMLINVDDVQINEGRFIYEELKFYLDKFFLAWLTLGTVSALCVTILWMAPADSFKMVYEERVVWTEYMLFCILTVTILVAVSVAYPIFKNLKKIRNVIFSVEKKTGVTTSDASG
jgi:hypothetical protein